MAEEWFYSSGMDQRGPYSVADLRRMLRSAEIATSGYLCRPGMAEWKPVRDMVDSLSLRSKRDECSFTTASETTEPVVLATRKYYDQVRQSALDREFSGKSDSFGPGGITGFGRTQFAYASWQRRTVASLIDGLLLSIVLIGLAFVMFSFRPETIRDRQSVEDSFRNVYWIAYPIVLVCFAALQSSTMRGTLGMLAVGVKITDCQGNRISFSRAMLRQLLTHLSAVLFCIGFFMILFTEKQQGLHDMLTTTVLSTARYRVSNFSS